MAHPRRLTTPSVEPCGISTCTPWRRRKRGQRILQHRALQTAHRVFQSDDQAEGDIHLLQRRAPRRRGPCGARRSAHRAVRRLLAPPCLPRPSIRPDVSGRPRPGAERLRDGDPPHARVWMAGSSVATAASTESRPPCLAGPDQSNPLVFRLSVCRPGRTLPAACSHPPAQPEMPG